jgi:hypothetical protein
VRTAVCTVVADAGLARKSDAPARIVRTTCAVSCVDDSARITTSVTSSRI